MNLKKSLIIAVTLSIVSLTAWELYWRSQGFRTDLDDNEALWAVQRERVEKATDKDILLMGSSRVLFDIQLDQCVNGTIVDCSALQSEKQQLLELQRLRQETSDLIEQTVERVNRGVSLNQSTTASFTKISESAVQVAELVSQIAKASQEQTQGVAHCGIIINQIYSLLFRHFQPRIPAGPARTAHLPAGICYARAGRHAIR